MTVWYSSFDNDMMSDRAHEEHFNALMESYDSNDDFEAFLGETYSFIELFNLTEYERGKAREAFEDWKREKASARVNSKKLAENAPILDAIRNLMDDNKKRLTSEVAVELELSTPKASALLRQLVALGELDVEDVKVKGKGAQKCYVAHPADAE